MIRVCFGVILLLLYSLCVVGALADPNGHREVPAVTGIARSTTFIAFPGLLLIYFGMRAQKRATTQGKAVKSVHDLSPPQPATAQDISNTVTTHPTDPMFDAKVTNAHPTTDDGMFRNIVVQTEALPMPQADVATSLLNATKAVLVSLLLLLYAVIAIAIVIMVGPIAFKNRGIIGLTAVLLLAACPGLLWINAGMRSRRRAVAQQRFRKDRLERLAQLNEGEEYDLVQLYQMGAVSPRATGQSITRINAEVQNLTDKKLCVIIRTGTYFISSDIHQNMVTRTEHRFRLHERATERFGVPAACINAESPIPVEDDHFSGVASVSDDLTRFLEQAGGEDPMVIQAGVWAITDNYSQYEVRNKLMTRSSQGDMRPAISVDQVATAQRLLNQLGIPNRL